jgi:tetratricopeptide (TPR) repeat protein
MTQRVLTLVLACGLWACASAPPLEHVLRLKRECRYDEARQLVLQDLPRRVGTERAQQLLLLASVEEHAGNLETAVGYFKDASFSASGDPTVKAQALKMLGLAQTSAKQYAGAVASFTDYEGRLAERRARLEAGIVGIPWDVHAAWAVSLAEMGRFQDAAAQFAKSAEQASERSAVNAALRVWQRRAEEAAAGQLKPQPGYSGTRPMRTAALAKPATSPCSLSTGSRRSHLIPRAKATSTWRFGRTRTGVSRQPGSSRGAAYRARSKSRC